jgi:hypothetical protein
MMNPFSILVVTIVAGTLLAGPAIAEDIALSLSGVELVTGPDGRVRFVLPAATPIIEGHVSLGDAWLRLPGLPLSIARDLRIHVRAVSGPWAPGGDIPVHEGLVGRLSLPRGAAARGIDVTNLVRGVLSGAELHGFLVTVPEGSGSGFESEDAPLLLAAFQEAALEISYRRIPPPPRRRW